MSAPLETALVALLAAFAGNGNAVSSSQDPPAPQAHDDAAIHKEMEDLIKKVEVDLKRIDSNLYTASTGRAAPMPENAGISELLKKAQADAHQAQSDMVRILELAKSHVHQSNCSGGNCVGKKLCTSVGGSGSKPSGSPSPSPRGKSPLDRPEGDREPGTKERAEKFGSKPTLGQGLPTSPGESPLEDPKNQLAGPPPSLKKEVTVKADPTERWGDLPLHAREVFRNSGNVDMPPQYVDWIDAYYRKLNKLR